MDVTRGDIAKALLDEKSIGGLRAQHSGGADWSSSTWKLPDGRYLIDDQDDASSWIVVRRYYVDDDYEGIPAKDRDEVDDMNDAIIVDEQMDLLEAIYFVMDELEGA